MVGHDAVLADVHPMLEAEEVRDLPLGALAEPHGGKRGSDSGPTRARGEQEGRPGLQLPRIRQAQQWTAQLALPAQFLHPTPQSGPESVNPSPAPALWVLSSFSPPPPTKGTSSPPPSRKGTQESEG